MWSGRSARADVYLANEWSAICLDGEVRWQGFHSSVHAGIENAHVYLEKGSQATVANVWLGGNLCRPWRSVVPQARLSMIDTITVVLANAAMAHHGERARVSMCSPKSGPNGWTVCASESLLSIIETTFPRVRVIAPWWGQVVAKWSMPDKHERSMLAVQDSEAVTAVVLNREREITFATTLHPAGDATSLRAAVLRALVAEGVTMTGPITWISMRDENLIELHPWLHADPLAPLLQSSDLHG